MASTPKILADGQVAATSTTLYAVPALTQAIIRTVSFVNVSGSDQAVVFRIKKSGGTSRVFSRVVLATNEFAHEEDIGTLDAGDSIEAETTNATSVDYSVMGVEVTA
jgi:hypothetical protein